MSIRGEVVGIYYWTNTAKDGVRPRWFVDALSKWPNPGGIKIFPQHKALTDGGEVEIGAYMVVRAPEDDDCPYCGHAKYMSINPGNFVMSGLRDEIYSLTPDEFERRYGPEAPVTKIPD